MPKIAQLFYDAHINTGKEEFIYNGRTVKRTYRLDIPGEYLVNLEFVSTRADVEQAIDLHLYNFTGDIYVNGKKFKPRRKRFPQLILSERNSPRKVELRVILREGHITVSNASELDGYFTSLIGNCAMIFEQLTEQKLRCYCSDFTGTEEFDALIFDMEIVPVVQDLSN